MQTTLLPLRKFIFVPALVFALLATAAPALSEYRDNDTSVSNEEEQEAEIRPTTVRETESRPGQGQAIQRPQDRELIQQRRQAFEERVREQLTERQQQAALRAASGLNEAHTRLSRNYLRYIDNMEVVLTKITNRAEIFESEGYNMEAVYTAVAAAEDIVAAAREDINNLMNKDYTVDVEGAESIGQALRLTVDELRQDHQDLRQGALTEVRQAVQGAFLALREGVSQAPMAQEEEQPVETQPQAEQPAEQEVSTEEAPEDPVAPMDY